MIAVVAVVPDLALENVLAVASTSFHASLMLNVLVLKELVTKTRNNNFKNIFHFYPNILVANATVILHSNSTDSAHVSLHLNNSVAKKPALKTETIASVFHVDPEPVFVHLENKSVSTLLINYLMNKWLYTYKLEFLEFRNELYYFVIIIQFCFGLVR